MDNRIEEVARQCLRVLSYYDRQNLEYEIERQYKIEKGYDKMGLNWAFTDEDRQNIRSLKEEAVEWVLLLEAIPIICQLFPQPLDEGLKVLVDGEWVEASRELKDTARSIEQALPNKELREKALLTAKEFKAVLKEFYPKQDMQFGDLFKEVAKAQRDKDFALLQPKIEEAVKAEYDTMVKRCVDEGNDAYKHGEKAERERIIKIVNTPYGQVGNEVSTNSVLLFRKLILSRIGKS